MLAPRTPSGSHSATAVGFRHLHQSVRVSRAHSAHQLAETVTRSAILTKRIFINRRTNKSLIFVKIDEYITDALFSVGTDFVTLVALALVRSFGVDTVAVLAQIGVRSAFIDVAAVVRHSHLSVTFGTDAHERADEVLAGEFAIVRWSGAFIDIYTKKEDTI